MTRDQPFFFRLIIGWLFLVSRNFHSSCSEAWFCKIIFLETRFFMNHEFLSALNFIFRELWNDHPMKHDLDPPLPPSLRQVQCMSLVWISKPEVFVCWGGSDATVGILLSCINLCFSLSQWQFQPIFVSFLLSYCAVLRPYCLSEFYCSRTSLIIGCQTNNHVTCWV